LSIDFNYRNITRGNITKNQAGEGLGSILTLQDIIQEGNLGLMEAAEQFDPRTKQGIDLALTQPIGFANEFCVPFQNNIHASFDFLHMAYLT
jgi:hypothetical protein